jgi:UDP-N-acetylmuramyl tripeptide synthase
VRAGARGAAAKLAGRLAQASGRGGGTSLPGKLLLRMDARAIERLARGLDRTAVISATNGKTTTAAMTSAILERGGARLVHNRAGANMAGGIASTLLYGKGDTGLFEVDEFWLDGITEQLRPDALLLANLFRDQLDRYGELETIADRWALVAASGHARRLVLNADDPLIADLAREAQSDVVFFGVDDPSLALPDLQHAADSTHCRLCGAPYTYDLVLMGHLGHYHCPNCDSRRPEPQVVATAITLDGIRGARISLRTPQGDADVRLPLPGLYNVYNALAAAALGLALGAPLSDVVAGLEGVSPAGANEVLRTLALEDGEHDLLAILNDNIADGRDISWIWDADFELLAPRVRRAVCAGTRAPELALRLKYAGVPVERLEVEPRLSRALDRAVAGAPGRVVALPTYTAMLALREELVSRGVAGSSFG